LPQSASASLDELFEPHLLSAERFANSPGAYTGTPELVEILVLALPLRTMTADYVDTAKDPARVDGLARALDFFTFSPADRIRSRRPPA
jgi:hypothetical protein